MPGSPREDPQELDRVRSELLAFFDTMRTAAGAEEPGGAGGPDPGFYAHLPELVITPGVRHRIGGAILMTLDADQWARMDSSFDTSSSKAAYTTAAPVFAFFPRNGSAPQDFPCDEVSLIHRSLLIASGRKLPDPALSIHYHYRSVRTISRQIGAHGREALLYSRRWTLHVGKRSARKARRVFDDLAQLSHRSQLSPEDSALDAAVDTLSRTASTHLAPATEFVHCVVALEALLIPGVTENIRAEFAARLHAVCSPGGGDTSLGPALGRLIYRVRDALLHGGDCDKILRKAGSDPRRFFPVARKALAKCTENLLTAPGAMGGGGR